MTRDEAIAEGKASLDQAQGDALGTAFDRGQASEGGGGITQEQVDQQIADAVAKQKSDDDAVLAQAHSDADAALAQAKSDLDAMTQKEQLEEGAVKALNDSIGNLQAALDSIKAIAQPPSQP